MPRFEVFVPAAPPALPADTTLRVEADSWLAALRAGLEQVGVAHAPTHVLCDVQADGSIHVTDAQAGGVFRIRELVAPPPPAPLSGVKGRAPAAGAGVGAAAAGEAAAGAGARIGRAPAAAAAEDVLAEVFERVADLDRRDDRKGSLAFLLDLALEKVPCEAGSVFLARLGSQVLEFAVARGPRAQEILKLGLTVPMGVGIAGFCARENVALAVSDVDRDPRFHREISEAVGHETRSLLCAPIARAGRVLGAMELVNRRGAVPFGPLDLAVLSYLAHRAAELLAGLDE